VTHCHFPSHYSIFSVTIGHSFSSRPFPSFLPPLFNPHTFAWLFLNIHQRTFHRLIWRIISFTPSCLFWFTTKTSSRPGRFWKPWILQWHSQFRSQAQFSNSWNSLCQCNPHCQHCHLKRIVSSIQRSL
jgi:hypothetical protein